MDILIVTDARIYSNEGTMYADYAFFCVLKRYVDMFENVSLLAKEGNLSTMPKSAVPCPLNLQVNLCGNNKDFYFGANKNLLREKIGKVDLLVLRVPSVLSYQAATIAKRMGIPYLCEVVGCAWDALWNHSLKGKLIAPVMFFRMKKTVKNCSYATYVTSEFLQRRYPCYVQSINASNVQIDDTNIDVLEKRKKKNIIDDTSLEITLLTAAGIGVKYKGQQYVISAIPRLNRLGIKVKYYLAGAGNNKFLKKTAKKLGVENQVVFLGAVPHEELLKLMDKVDIYLQPSLQEGLPRAVIEAMSRGCACIGSDVAGIPELLDTDCIVRRKNVSDIVMAIFKYKTSDIIEKNHVSERNYYEAQKYRESVINQRRNDYFINIKKEICGDN